MTTTTTSNLSRQQRRWMQRKGILVPTTTQPMSRYATYEPLRRALSVSSLIARPTRMCPAGHSRMSREAPVDAATDSDLTLYAYRLAVEKFGQDRLSDAHRKALMYIAARLTHMVTGHARQQFGRHTLRLAYGLTCGGGKTLSAKAWIAAVVHLRKPYSVALAANEVEALCQIKRDLVDSFDVPEDKIGLIHTLGDRASEPATPVDDLDSKQIVLVSHNMVRTGEKNVALYNSFQGRPRDIVIYDESLIVSDAWSVKNKTIQAGLDFLRREVEYEGREDLRVVLEFMEDTLARLLAEVDAQRAGKVPAPVVIPDLSDYAEDLSPDGAKLLLPNPAEPIVKTILDASGREVRVVTEANRGIVWFQLKVPDDLHSVFVLDASHLIRKLPRLGGNIEPDDKAVDPGITYEDVTIEWFQEPAGYGSIKTECRKPFNERTLAKKLADWIKSLPEGERVVVWTFKQRDKQHDPDIPTVLEATLARHGVDMERVSILTHGSNKGTNAFASSHATAFYGVFEQDKLSFAGQMTGQRRDLQASLEDLEEVHRSEIVHDLFQEIARSGIRQINQGRSGRGRVFLPIWHSDVPTRLVGRDVFPGAHLVWREDLDDHAEKIQTAHYRIVANSILSVLQETHGETTMSSQRLRPIVQKRVGFEVSDRVWKDATQQAREECQQVGWKPVGKSFVRFGGTDYGYF